MRRALITAAPDIQIAEFLDQRVGFRQCCYIIRRRLHTEAYSGCC